MLNSTLIIRKMQMETTVSYHFTASGDCSENKQEITGLGADVEKLESSCAARGNVR